MMPYQTKSAVLFIIFNRPGTTMQVFNQVKAAKPARLYIAADGPRSDRPNEGKLCEECRHVTSLVDWPCEVMTLFRDHNLGCKEAVSSAITWFFEQEEEGIILEDDCLPDNSFFRFCDILLERYRFDTRIRHIGGCNFQHGQKRGDATYYFSNLTHVWGWAGWRRVWQDYDKELHKYSETNIKHYLSLIFNEPLLLTGWLQIFKELKADKIDTWDYQLAFLNFFNHGLSVIPNQNLISNIGFGADATHTVADNPNANIPLSQLPENIIHPLYILPEKEADRLTLANEFKSIAEHLKKHHSARRRFKRWLKRLVKSRTNN